MSEKLAVDDFKTPDASPWSTFGSLLMFQRFVVDYFHGPVGKLWIRIRHLMLKNVSQIFTPDCNLTNLEGPNQEGGEQGTFDGSFNQLDGSHSHQQWPHVLTAAFKEDS